jgi:preprotein translocase subunit YajC
MSNILAFLERLLQVVLLFGTFYFVLLSLSNSARLRLSSRQPRLRRGKKVSVLIHAHGTPRPY